MAQGCQRFSRSILGIRPRVRIVFFGECNLRDSVAVLHVPQMVDDASRLTQKVLCTLVVAKLISPRAELRLTGPIPDIATRLRTTLRGAGRNPFHRI